MRCRYVVISASVASLLLLSLSPVAIAQKTLTNKKLDSTYITDDFSAALVIHPSQLEKSSAGNTLKLERFASIIKEVLGVEPKQMEQVTLLLPSNLQAMFGGVARPPVEKGDPRRFQVERASQPFPFGGVLHLNEPLAGKELAAR